MNLTVGIQFPHINRLIDSKRLDFEYFDFGFLYEIWNVGLLDNLGICF